MPVPTHRWKDPLMDFVIGVPIFIDWKKESYDAILILVDLLTKIVYHELVKITIDVAHWIEIIIDMVVRYHGFSEFNVRNQGLLFTSKFKFLPYYFFGIK